MRRSPGGGAPAQFVPLARTLRQQAAEQARQARRQAILLLPLFAAVIVAYVFRRELFGLDTPVRLGAAIGMVILGWALARDIGRAITPALERRIDRGSAGTAGFLVRLAFLGVVLIAALRLAGIQPKTLLAGGAFTAVVVGLAAQQTFGNLVAGLVLLSARPFVVGDRVRLHAGAVGGQVEGTVTAQGLLYTTLASGGETMMVPNNVVLAAAVVPLREPDAVDLRARLRPGVWPSEVQSLLDEQITTPTRATPHIGLEEVDGDEVVVRILATPSVPTDGPQLADEILYAVSQVTRAAETVPPEHPRRRATDAPLDPNTQEFES